MSVSDSKVVIVGPGAIGTLFAVRLQSSGIPVALAGSDPRAARRFSSKPTRVYTKGNEFDEAFIRYMAGASDLQRKSPEFLVFTVKAYDTEKAARQWKFLVGRETRVVSIQNGLGNLEVLKRFFGPATKIICAVTSEASLILSPGSVRHTAKGITKVAPLSKSSLYAAKRFAEMLQAAGLRSALKSDAHDILWGKLVVNSAINPLSAITGLTNGGLLASEMTRKLLSEIAYETYVVGKRAAHVNPDIEDAKDPGAYVMKAAKATAKNKSSMLQDILRSKRTEVDYINGAICRLARKKKKRIGSLRAPLNEAMLSLVRALEKNKEMKK